MSLAVSPPLLFGMIFASGKPNSLVISHWLSLLLQCLDLSIYPNIIGKTHILIIQVTAWVPDFSLQECLHFLCNWLMLQENCLNRFTSIPVNPKCRPNWHCAVTTGVKAPRKPCTPVSMPSSYQATIYSAFNRPDVETYFCKAWAVASPPMPLRPSYLVARKLNIPWRLGFVCLFVKSSASLLQGPVSVNSLHLRK